MQNNTTSFGVIGLGRFGTALASHLSEMGLEVMVIDMDEVKVKALRPFTELAFVVNDLSIETLRETGIQNCDTVVVCIGEKIDASILATLHVKQLGVKNIIARATTDDLGTILTSIGASIVFPERDMAIRLASKLASTNILDNISLSSEADITEIRLNSRMNGKTVRNFDFRGRFNLNVIAIVRAEKTIIEINPDDPLHEGDVIAVVGRKENIAHFEAFLTK